MGDDRYVSLSELGVAAMRVREDPSIENLIAFQEVVEQRTRVIVGFAPCAHCEDPDAHKEHRLRSMLTKEDT